jgi:hypothetical protein
MNRLTRWLAAASLLLTALPLNAQLAGGTVYGVVADESGAALPGATLTIAGNGPTFTTTSGADGGYRFLNLDPGTYQVTAALTGFSKVVRENVVIVVGANVQIPVRMKVAQLEETITVQAESPVIDARRTGTSTNFTQDELAKIPNSRDPWALLRTVPGAVLDRVNIAGNETGQQAQFTAKGAPRTDSVWNMDGVMITDMSATGASPTYFDYDAFEEIQISTGASDIRQPTGGVGLNFVTKRGTNSLRGTLRGYYTDDSLESCNVPDELLATGTTCETADHNKQISDYGVDLGGPIVKDKLWFWGSYGKQDIRLVRSAGNVIDKTLLPVYNVKLNWQASQRDMLSILYFNGDKQKFGRAPGNAQVEPDSATWNQANAYEDNPIHGLLKLEENHTFSPNFFLSAKLAYYNTGFQLDPRGGLDGQAGISARLGRTFGTTQGAYFVRPQRTANLDGNYFFGGLGGNHELRFGGGYRYAKASSNTIWPGDKSVAFDNSATDKRARLYREGLGINEIKYLNLYFSDTFTRDRFTLNVGLRWDRQWGAALPSDISSNGAFPNLVPAVAYAGEEAPFTWNDVTPRIGLTYALDDSRKTQLRASYARYASQLDTAHVGFTNVSGAVGYIEYPWNDANGDQLVQPNEVNTSVAPLASSGIDPANPSSVSSPNRMDADLRAPMADEFIVGIDRELAPNLAASLSFTRRHNSRFTWAPRIGMTTADYAPGATLTGTLPDGSSYSIPTFVPDAAKVAAGASGRYLTNIDDYDQSYNGIELAATKRLSNRWMARLAASWNDHTESWSGTPVIVYWPRSPILNGNPTGVSDAPVREGGQVAKESTGSGGADIFINAKWSVNLNAMYQLPAGFEVAANLFGKQGTPYPLFRQQALGLDGSAQVLVSPEVDSFRFDDLWNLDLRLAKNLNAGRVNMLLTADLFNATNSNAVLKRQRNVASPVFNTITQNLSPRILRLGLRLSF